MPGTSPCGQGSWVERVTWMVAAASPKGQLVAPASCKERERRGAGELLLPPSIQSGAGYLPKEREKKNPGM